MKLSFNKYGNPCANGASINVDTLTSVLDCLDIKHKLKAAPAEMREDDFKLASDYEAQANRKELFRIMLNFKSDLEIIVPLIESRISEAGNAYEIVTGWEI